MPVRVASVMQKNHELKSPFSDDTEDPAIFTVKLADTRATIQRQDLFSKIRYIQSGPEGEVVTERSFPMGQLRIETVGLVLVDWNLSDAVGNKQAITNENILKLLKPEEVPWLYDEIIKLNPVWNPEGE